MATQALGSAAVELRLTSLRKSALWTGAYDVFVRIQEDVAAGDPVPTFEVPVGHPVAQDPGRILVADSCSGGVSGGEDCLLESCLGCSPGAPGNTLAWTQTVSFEAGQEVALVSGLFRLHSTSFLGAIVDGCFRFALDRTTGELGAAPAVGDCAFDIGETDSVECDGASCSVCFDGPAGSCVSGWLFRFEADATCVPTSTVDDTCDGLDDDCDGTPDDDFVPFSQPCGALPGACRGSVALQCVGGNVVGGACEGISEPTQELCDGVDNDCDGEVDDDPFFIVVPDCPPGECTAQSVTTCVDGALLTECAAPELELCDGLDNDCDGQVDDDTVDTIAVPVFCGVGECSNVGLAACEGGEIVGHCEPRLPTPEVFDLEDNDCDGLVNECEPGQGDWWCCSENDVITLDFNVVPGTDVNPAEQCVPLSEDPAATCSLRGVFQVADQTIANGCHIRADVQSGEYRITEELALRRGRLLLAGADHATTRVRPDTSCISTCDGDCSVSVGHRLVNVTADSTLTPFLQIEEMTFRGGGLSEGGNFSQTIDDGGGILVDGALFLAERVVIEDNRAFGHGAGLAVYDSPAATVRDSVIRNNINGQAGCSPATHQGGGQTARGGGVYVADSLMTIERSSILGNTSSDGGGVAAQGTAGLTVINSTIANNGASATGGGILANAELELYFNTLADNFAGFDSFLADDMRGGGLALGRVGLDSASASLALRAYGNVLSRNITGADGFSDDCSTAREGDPPAVIDAGFNLIDHDVADCEPMTNPEWDVLGPSAFFLEIFPPPADASPVDADFLVYALNPDSPAIGVYPPSGSLPVGPPACPLTDQRGYLRPLDAPCTLGAYEANGIPDDDGDGIPNSLDTQPLLFSNLFTDVGLFGRTQGTIEARGQQELAIYDLPGWTRGVVVVASPRGGALPAEISACDGSIQETLSAGESVTIECPGATSCVFAEEELVVLDRARIQSAAFSRDFTISSDAAVGGDVEALGDGWLYDRASIGGDATLGGTLGGDRGGVGGVLSESATVTPQAIALREASSNGPDVTVALDGHEVLSPGEHGDVLVRSRGTLRLDAPGLYRFASLTFDPDASFELSPGNDGIVVAVAGDVILGDRVAMSGEGGLDAEDVLLYSNGELVRIGHDSEIAGTIAAPLADVEVQDRSVLNGCVGGKNVTIRHDATVGDGTAQSPLPDACQPATYEAEGMFHSTGGATPGGWNLWTNGYVSTTHDFEDTSGTIRVRAKGQVANGTWPHMVVKIDGAVVGGAYVTSVEWQDYAVAAAVGPGTREVRVAFDNDFYAPPQDRNLLVDRLTVECE